MVEDTLVIDDDPTVNTPVEVETVNNALPVAFPARFANISCPFRAVFVIPAPFPQSDPVPVTLPDAFT